MADDVSSTAAQDGDEDDYRAREMGEYDISYDERRDRFEDPALEVNYDQFRQELDARLEADQARYPADALEAVRRSQREAAGGGQQDDPIDDPVAERVYNLDEQRFEDEDPPPGMVYNLDTGQWEPE